MVWWVLRNAAGDEEDPTLRKDGGDLVWPQPSTVRHNGFQSEIKGVGRHSSLSWARCIRVEHVPLAFPPPAHSHGMITIAGLALLVKLLLGRFLISLSRTHL